MYSISNINYTSLINSNTYEFILYSIYCYLYFNYKVNNILLLYIAIISKYKRYNIKSVL